MGIFDGASQRQLAAGSFQELEAEQVRRINLQHAYNNMAQNSLTGVTSGLVGAKKQEPRFDPNKNEAYQIPLSQLVAMWQVKYGDQWVDGNQVYNPEDFFASACIRLTQNDLFERVDGWVRLKENVENLLANR